MKQTLVPGKEIEITTPGEVAKIVRSLIGKLNSDQRTARPYGNGKTTAAGAIDVTVYDVPVGLEFALHRLTVDADGFTPGAPFNAAAGFLQILRGDEPMDFIPLALGSGGIPAVYTAGTADAPRFRNGEVVVLRVVGGPANTVITVRGQGTLGPVTTE